MLRYLRPAVRNGNAAGAALALSAACGALARAGVRDKYRRHTRHARAVTASRARVWRPSPLQTALNAAAVCGDSHGALRTTLRPCCTCRPQQAMCCTRLPRPAAPFPSSTCAGAPSKPAAAPRHVPTVPCPTPRFLAQAFVGLPMRPRLAIPNLVACGIIMPALGASLVSFQASRPSCRCAYGTHITAVRTFCPAAAHLRTPES